LRDLPLGCFGLAAKVRERCRELRKEFVRFALDMSEDVMTDDDFSSFFTLYGYMEKMEAAVRENSACLSIKKIRTPNLAVMSILRDIRHILTAER
jgi:hypothetical protein